MTVFRLALSCALIFTFNFSVCTGGWFSVPVAFAAQSLSLEETTGEHGIVLMSLATVENYTCPMAQEVHQDEEDHHDAHGECDGSDACLRHSYRSSAERWVGASPEAEGDVILLAAVADADVFGDSGDGLMRARAGPLFESSALFAHSLVKRE